MTWTREYVYPGCLGVPVQHWQGHVLCPSMKCMKWDEHVHIWGLPLTHRSLPRCGLPGEGCSSCRQKPLGWAPKAHPGPGQVLQAALSPGEVEDSPFLTSAPEHESPTTSHFPSPGLLSIEPGPITTAPLALPWKVPWRVNSCAPDRQNTLHLHEAGPRDISCCPGTHYPPGSSHSFLLGTPAARLREGTSLAQSFAVQLRWLEGALWWQAAEMASQPQAGGPLVVAGTTASLWGLVKGRLSRPHSGG